MTSDEIRERYLSFFEEREHLRIPSASLVPPPGDRTVLLTTAGMQPLKPYFLGRESPPAPKLTSCQKCFRTPDIDKVGLTSRHLTFFEMLGNFSIGAYFKAEAIALAWELSREVFSFDPDDVWVTVFAGDEALGLGPDEEAIELWQGVGVPRERIVPCPRSENFWEAGPVGPSGPCSELYLDRGLSFGSPEDLPGGENERFLEYWNLVFMQYDQDPHDHLQPLPTRNIDTGLGLNRLASILQGKDSVFDTDQFQPLIELGRELSGTQADGTGSPEHAGQERAGEDLAERALRILADHSRGMSFLIADGVVPSNEDRGYVLRRLTRRAILQARRLHMEPGFLVRYATVVRELMADAYPELLEQREAIEGWLASEEDSFGRTLEQGTRLLEELIARAREDGRQTIAAADAFRLHDTFGFPFDLTLELLAERDLGVEDPGEFDRLMDAQRARARAAAAGVTAENGATDTRRRADELVASAGFQTRFTGYENELQRTTVGAVVESDGALLVKLAESPFYPAGGGQVSDMGTIECAGGDCAARVTDVFRVGNDQTLAVVLERGTLRPQEPVLARVDQTARRATERNHTATHLLHAALRERLGAHVRQAGSYVGPDKLRFDFTHAGALTAEELEDVEDAVNSRVADGDPVRAISTTLDEAKRLGAMALFGEKYGEVVRMVQIGDGSYSRELCGGTHVHTTAEIGPFLIVKETSSAANVRRIEALTGAAATELLRSRDRELRTIERVAKAPAERVPAVLKGLIEVKASSSARGPGGRGPGGRAPGGRAPGGRGPGGRGLGEGGLGEGGPGDGGLGEVDIEALAARAVTIGGTPVLTESVSVADPKALLDLLDRLRGRLDGAAIVLGAVVDGRVHLAAAAAPELVERGIKAGEIVKTAAAVVGGGGGGRDTLAQAGGREPAKLAQALAAARDAIEAMLAS
jgi:alanyl-tRNA synthetase